MSVETIRAKSFVEKLRELDPEMQLQTVLVLLLISEGHETGSWCRVKDLAEKVSLTSASASRNVAVFNKWDRHRNYGHNLVTTWENPKCRVEKFIKLTPKGEKFMQEIKNIM